MSKMWQRADFWPADRREPELCESDFARGAAEARRTVEAEVASERNALMQLVSALEALQPPSAALITSLIVASVERLVVDIAGNAPIDGALLRERAEALAALAADQGEVVLALHPDDVHFLDGVCPIISDAAVPRGTVQAKTKASAYEDGVAQALDRLRAEIERIGLAT